MPSIIVDNKTIECSDYDFDKMELDLDSGRNLNGVMERNILAHHPRKITVKFPPMNGPEMAQILNTLDHPELNITAFNPFTNSTETMKMMHGDLKTSIYWDGINPITGQKEILFNKFNVELVEY